MTSTDPHAIVCHASALDAGIKQEMCAIARHDITSTRALLQCTAASIAHVYANAASALTHRTVPRSPIGICESQFFTMPASAQRHYGVTASPKIPNLVIGIILVYN